MRRAANKPATPFRARSGHAISSSWLGFRAFVPAAHYWTMLHRGIETVEDMRVLVRDNAELCGLLLNGLILIFQRESSFKSSRNNRAQLLAHFW
jgi:hypothetical protein